MRPTVLAYAAGAALASLLLAGCASKPTQPPPINIAEPQLQLAPTPPVTARRKAELHTELAAGYYERGQMNVALDELKSAEAEDATYPKIYNVYGLVYTMLGEAAKAEANFRRALQMAPDDSEIHHNWGAFLCSHGHPKESIPEFEIAARDPLYKSPAIALTNAGKCSIAAGDKVAGEAFFLRALSLKPQDSSAAYNLALLKYREGSYDQALQLMHIVIQQNDAPAPALYLGMCIERKKNDQNSADSYVQQIKNRYPESPEAKNLDGKDC